MKIRKGSITTKVISAGVSLALSLGIAAHSRMLMTPSTTERLLQPDMYRVTTGTRSLPITSMSSTENKDKYLYTSMPNYIGLAAMRLTGKCRFTPQDIRRQNCSH